MIKTEFMPDNTKMLFEYFVKSDVFRDARMTLLGGTALAVLIGHRLSEDLDFFSFGSTLPQQSIGRLIQQMKSDGLNVTNVMDQSRISQARINGIRLEEFIQEFAINDVKVSFGVMTKGKDPIRRREHLNMAPTIDFDAAFKIPDIQTLFESKSVLLMDRVKSRDLFDLMILVDKHDYGIEDIINAIMTIDGHDENNALNAIEVLSGNIPLDNDDPGFKSISLEVEMSEIYNFFNQKILEFEKKTTKIRLKP